MCFAVLAGTALGSFIGTTFTNPLTYLSLGSTLLGGISSIQQGQTSSAIASQNADLARQQQIDALRRGSTAEGEQRTKVQKFIGAQRAIMGGSGVVTDSGSGGDVLADTAAMGERDAQRIRVNAAREAWGYATEASNYDYQAKEATKQSYFKAGTTILGGTFDLLRPAPWWKQQWANATP